MYPCTGLDKTFGLQEVESFKVSRKSAHTGDKVVSLYAQEIFLVLISVRS